MRPSMRLATTTSPTTRPVQTPWGSPTRSPTHHPTSRPTTNTTFIRAGTGYRYAAQYAERHRLAAIGHLEHGSHRQGEHHGYHGCVGGEEGADGLTEDQQRCGRQHHPRGAQNHGDRPVLRQG